jgi:hypothetical protein
MFQDIFLNEITNSFKELIFVGDKMSKLKDFDSVAVAILMNCEKAQGGTLIDPVLLIHSKSALGESYNMEEGYADLGHEMISDLVFHVTGYKTQIHFVHYDCPETVFYLREAAKYLKKIFPEIWGGIDSPYKGEGGVTLENRLPFLIKWQSQIREKFGNTISVPKNVILDSDELLEVCESLSKKIQENTEKSNLLKKDLPISPCFENQNSLKENSFSKSDDKEGKVLSFEFAEAFEQLNSWMKNGYFAPEKWSK